jgi:hypothetical protein
MSNSRDVRPGRSTLADQRPAATSALPAPGRRTLTASLPAIEGKQEPKGGGTAKISRTIGPSSREAGARTVVPSCTSTTTGRPSGRAR